MPKKFQTQRRKRKLLEREVRERRIFFITLAVALVVLGLAYMSTRGTTKIPLPGVSASR